MTTTPAPTSDAAIQSAVAAALLAVPGVDATHVGVSVRGGAVTLSGEVDGYPEKVVAERTALGVHGVTAVAEEITLSSPWGVRADGDVARLAGDALRAADDVPPSVTVTVNEGSLVLRGTVDLERQRAAAQRTVADLPGVREVLDLVHVHVHPATAPPSPRP
ncbi:MAG: BON domain-containing protein [Mycobacteriaceae bacterium]